MNKREKQEAVDLALDLINEVKEDYPEATPQDTLYVILNRYTTVAPTTPGIRAAVREAEALLNYAS